MHLAKGHGCDARLATPNAPIRREVPLPRLPDRPLPPTQAIARDLAAKGVGHDSTSDGFTALVEPSAIRNAATAAKEFGPPPPLHL